MKQKTVRIIVSLLISAAAGFALITGVYALPRGRMVNNIVRSHALLESEGNYRYWASDITKTQSDNFSDSLMADIAVNPGKGNLLYDAMINAYMAWEDTDNASEWLLRETGGEPLYPGSAQVIYGRYWHGYLIWMKPLLLFFTIPEIRLIAMGLQLILFAAAFMLCWRETGLAGTAAFTLAVLSLNPLSTIMSFHFADIIVNALISSIVIFLFHRKLDETDSWYLLFLFIGIAAAFFDLLTYPLVSLGFPLILYVLFSGRSLRDNCVQIILHSIVWVIGYAGMWVLKWVIGTGISGYNLVLDGLETVGFRSVGEVSNVSTAYGYVLSQNVHAMFTRPLIAGLLMCIPMLVIGIVSGKLKLRISLERLVPVIAVGIYPLIWYFVLRNHSIVHVWFTHRTLAVTVFALGACLACLVSPRKN